MGKKSLVLLALLLALAVGRVAAHAELVRAEPRAGSRLNAAPVEIRLTFSEAIGPQSTIALLGANFQTISGVALLDSGDPAVLVASVPDLEPGQYTVEYDAVSADDHTISGSYTFTVGAAAGGGLWIGIAAGVAGAMILTSLLVYRQRRARLIEAVRSGQPH